MRLLASLLLALSLVGASAAADQVAAARAYLERLEPLPADFRLGRFEPSPGIVLETGKLRARGPRRGTVVFVPGYTAPLELYAQEMRALAEAGWDVAAIVMRGQGRSVRLTGRPDLGYVEDYANLSADLAAFVARQHGPVVVIGLSQGGHVALRMAAEHGPDVAAYAVIVPMIRIQTGPLSDEAAAATLRFMVRNGAARRYLPGTVPWERRKPFAQLLGQGQICQPDPELAHLRRALMEVYPETRVEVPSPGWIDATFRSQAALDRLAPRIAAPVFMVTAGRDRVVQSDAAEAFCKGLADCRHVTLPDAPHCAVEGDAVRSGKVMGQVLPFLAGSVR